MTCHDTIELLPWLINGSLAETERRALREHLAACARCRRELEETVGVWEIATRHVPSRALAEYAQGLSSGAPDRERIERHLEKCPTCRQELEWAMPGRVSDFAAARAARAGASSPAGGPRWRQLAVAACVVATLAAAALIHSFGDLGTPRPLSAPAAEGGDRGRVQVAAEQRPERTSETGLPSLFRDGFEAGSTVIWSSSSQSTSSQSTE